MSSSSVRVQVVVPSGIYAHLKDRAEREGRSVSSLSLFLIEAALHSFPTLPGTAATPEPQ